MLQDPGLIYDALSSSLSEWRPNEQIPLKFLRFPYGFSDIGLVVECSLADEIDYRQQFVDKPLPPHRDGLQARKLLQPMELGILVEPFERAGKFYGNRRITDPIGITWIVVDCDSGVGGKPIVELLQELGVAYIYAESSTSRLNGDGIGKWHLFLPLAEPKLLPDRRGTDVAVVESAQAAAKWWCRVHSHVVACLFTMGGIGRDATGERKDDASLDRIVQGSFVPYRPDGSPARFLSFPQQGSRCLQLDEFLLATGFDDLQPPLIHLDEVERPQPLPDATTDESSPDDGATPGQTPGSLAYRALFALGLVGDFKKHKGGYEVLCPWRDSHESAVRSGTQDKFSSSTMVFMGNGQPGTRSGFHCFHAGCAATAGMGAAVSTSEILKFARSRGVSSEALPDRAAWAGSTALVGVAEEVAAAPSLPPPTLVTPFVLAPVVAASTTQPAAAFTLSLPDRKARAVIPIDEDRLAEMIDAGVDALSRHPRVYKAATTAGEKLVDLLEIPGAVPYVRAANAVTLAPELQKVSKWVVPSPKVLDDAALYGVAPHAKTVASILHAGYYPGVREIRGVVTAPTFHSDGLVVQTPGYNASMAVYYHPIDRVPLISEDPSQEMLLAAKGLLVGNVPSLRSDDDVLADFPFKKGTELLCRSVWLAGILTRLMRHTFKGNIPFFLVSAGDRSSGKGKLIDAAALISDGVFSESISFSASDDENERIIGMFMQSAAPVVHVDNVRGTLSSTKYEAYSTTPNFSTRSIGTSSKIAKTKQEGIVDTTVWFSGNGLTTGGDMSRRGLRIDIEDTTGTPGSRVVRPGWEGLTPRVKEARPQLLGAALTLISGFFAARRRGYRLKPPSFASFDEWSIVREVIVWMGLPDPVLAVGAASDDDVDSLHGHLLQHLRDIGCDEKEMLQSDIVKKLIADNATRTPTLGGFYAFLSEQQIDMTRPGPASQQLGTWLRSQGYIGRTLKAADGRRWKLVKRRVSGGTTLTVREMRS